MLGRLTFAALILAAAVSGASGLEAMLGDVFVTLPPPAGFCELTPRYEFDGRMVAVASGLLQKGGSKLLVMSADCSQLAEARTGRRLLLDDAAQYVTPIATIDKPPAQSVAHACTSLRKRANWMAYDINARLASVLEKIKINETVFIGVLGEDTNACYAATLQRFRTEGGAERTQAVVFAVTIIRNRTIVIYRLAVYQNQETFNAVLAKLKVDAIALVAANP